MNQYEFGYFPRNKYKDLVFYVKTGEHSNMGLFEMEDTEENRAIMDALIPHPYQSERDAVLEGLHIWFENYCEGNEDPDLWMAFLHAERTLRQEGSP